MSRRRKLPHVTIAEGVISDVFYQKTGKSVTYSSTKRAQTYKESGDLFDGQCVGHVDARPVFEASENLSKKYVTHRFSRQR